MFASRVSAATLLLAVGTGFAADQAGAQDVLGKDAMAAASKPVASVGKVPAQPRPAANLSKPLWEELSVVQRKALAPLATHWDGLSASQKRKWIALSKNHHELPLPEQALLHARMGDWVMLSPQQRRAARLNFAETKRISSGEKQQQWDAYKALSPDAKNKLTESAQDAAAWRSGSSQSRISQKTDHCADGQPQRNGSPEACCTQPDQSAYIAAAATHRAPHARAEAPATPALAISCRTCCPDFRQACDALSLMVGWCSSVPYHLGPMRSSTSLPDGAEVTKSNPTPGLWRRMACWLYEGLLLFGVIFIAGYLFGTLSQTRNALDNRHLLQFFLFLVFGIYFVWFWSRGQTLAMKTWHLRVVDATGKPPSQPRALLRYLCCWLWFVPPFAGHGAVRVTGCGAGRAVAGLGWCLGFAEPISSAQISSGTTRWLETYLINSEFHDKR